jgi:hypothetical protein
MARHAYRVVAIVLVIGALLFTVRLVAGSAHAPETVIGDAPTTSLAFRGDGAGTYLTGDLVGDANPAEVYPALSIR